MKLCYLRYALDGSVNSRVVRILLSLLTIPLMGALYLYIFVRSGYEGLKEHRKEYHEYKKERCK
jgi:hypothetical protein